MKEYRVRKEYDRQYHAYVWNIYSWDIERICEAELYRFNVPEHEVDATLRKLNAYFIGPGEYPDMKQWPSFEQWLIMRHRTTLQKLQHIGRMTSSHSEFEAAMEWYRRQYRRDKTTWECLRAHNPFIKQNGGFNYEPNV